MKLIMICVFLLSITLTGCVKIDTNKATTDGHTWRDYFTFQQDVTGYGKCTLLYAKRPSDDSGTVTLIGCKK